VSILHKLRVGTAPKAELIRTENGTIGVSVNGTEIDLHTALRHRFIEVRRAALQATRANRDDAGRRALEVVTALNIGG
jgi:hypothetical protein